MAEEINATAEGQSGGVVNQAETAQNNQTGQIASVNSAGIWATSSSEEKDKTYTQEEFEKALTYGRT